MTQRKPKTFHDWQQLRRTSRNQYYSAKTQREILEDRLTLGDRFYDKPNKDDTKATAKEVAKVVSDYFGIKD